ncbi:hypothetical protein [Microbacterium hydrocarbonoxydans]|uniref:hypothetical protein n=1 Tax=Microbacterium hydrocarbonoxydans TaxID=273678 RepID=UPI003D99B13F
MTWGTPETSKLSGRRADRVRDALQTIIAEIEKNRRSRGEHPAWGQFLDVPVANRQIGIYGTASAIQLLSHAPMGASSAMSAMPTLPGTDLTDAKVAFPADDLDLTLKCCSIIEARAALGARASAVTPVEEVLLASLHTNADLSLPVPESLDGAFAGWGFATNRPGVDFAEVGPELLPTAQVILALRTSSVESRVLPGERGIVSRRLGLAMRWAAQEAVTSLDSTPVECAFTLLAAKTFIAEPGALGMQPEKLVRQLRKTIKTRLRGIRVTDLPRAEPRFYAVPRSGGNTDNHYVTFPVHYILSWALADRMPRRLPRQREIFDVCDQLSQAVRAHGAPVSMATGRKSITDSMYAVHLLRTVTARVTAIDSMPLRRHLPHLAAVVGTGLGFLALLGLAVFAGIGSVSGDSTELRGIATFAVGILPIPAIALARQSWKLIRRGP